MNHNSLIEVLEANHLLRSPDKVTIFEQTLAELVQNPDPADLPVLHLLLDDACEQPEVMFNLVHFLEPFDVQNYLSLGSRDTDKKSVIPLNLVPKLF